MRLERDITRMRQRRGQAAKARISVTFILAPALVVAGVAMWIGIASAPPRHAARAAFTIDWKTVPAEPNVVGGVEVADNWRKRIGAMIVSLPRSQEQIDELLDRAGDLEGRQLERPVAVSKIKRWLRVTVANEPGDVDRVTVEMRDGDPNWAQAVVNAVLQNDVARTRGTVSKRSLLTSFPSLADAGDVDHREAELRQELGRLEQSASRPFPDAVQQRYDALKAELNQLELQHVETTSGFMANVAGMVLDRSVQIAEEPHILKPRSSSAVLAVLAAIAWGIAAGMLGFGLHKIVLVLSMAVPPATTSAANAASDRAPNPQPTTSPGATPATSTLHG